MTAATAAAKIGVAPFSIPVTLLDTWTLFADDRGDAVTVLLKLFPSLVACHVEVHLHAVDLLRHAVAELERHRERRGRRHARRGVIRVGEHRNPARPRVVGHRGTANRPRKGQIDHSEVGREGMQGRIHRRALHGVGRCMRHGGRAFDFGDLDEGMRDERPRERGRERVDALVAGVRLEAGEDEVAHEAVATVHHVGPGRPGRERACRDPIGERATADVHGERDHLGAVLLTALPQALATFEGWETVVFGGILILLILAGMALTSVSF